MNSIDHFLKSYAISHLSLVSGKFDLMTGDSERKAENEVHRKLWRFALVTAAAWIVLSQITAGQNRDTRSEFEQDVAAGSQALQTIWRQSERSGKPSTYIQSRSKY
jgi:hypothetical protein